tara:strand:- start:2509 stop:2967 length:459 start_codon:yes stop_codon:yes gene_type:complete
MVYQFLRGVFVTSVISGIFGALAYSTGYSFLNAFVFTFTIQIIIFNIVKYIRDGFVITKSKELEVQKIREFTKQSMELSCAHCNAKAIVPIRLDRENAFECPTCGKGNSLYINVTVARETTPLNLQAITTKMIIDEEQKAKDEIIIEGSKND